MNWAATVLVIREDFSMAARRLAVRAAVICARVSPETIVATARDADRVYIAVMRRDD